VKVDDFLCTSNPHVFAAGDVCMPHRFTNVAQATGRLAATNALTGRRKRKTHLIVPWCAFCDPEIAHIGMRV
jgi:pyruvate/2-oxoglutarate dehydrogenase complex dihydrolipoamide dehydrogenase (E3) component